MTAIWHSIPTSEAVLFTEPHAWKDGSLCVIPACRQRLNIGIELLFPREGRLELCGLRMRQRAY